MFKILVAEDDAELRHVYPLAEQLLNFAIAGI